MALITCPECGHSISDKAAACPHCGFPLQPSLSTMNCETASKVKQKRRKQRRCFTELKNKKRIAFFAILSGILVTALIVSILSICILSKSKDEAYLYEWMNEHGTLIEGARLQYADYCSDGSIFSLNYDTVNYVDRMKWYVEYIAPAKDGYRIKVRVTLYWDESDSPVLITVSGSPGFEGYSRSLEYSHLPKTFTENSPIKRVEFSGSTVAQEVYNGKEYVTIYDDKKGLQWELDKMDQKCTIYAQYGLCKALDWIKEVLCPAADMSMSDFGYEAYE